MAYTTIILTAASSTPWTLPAAWTNADNIIEAMVRKLKPVLNNPVKAKQLLDQFWSDKMALVWEVRDVHTAANEREVALTNKEAIKVLQELHHYHNNQYGIININ